ncbi:uncharacterized protein LOC143149654 [Ptiloglossa arizonensis]|uniref:uncharacterized protein LOC143149654 n=1 Tax=Ptiloglossa arizonensis TaxID=3350558 RepID=UPI003F9EE6D2
MKNFILLLLLNQLVLIVVGQPIEKQIDINGTSTSIVDNQGTRCRRTLKPQTPSCSINQYFDEEEGRCLGITGGGKLLHVNNIVSCGINVLKPHCSNPRYYYICKRNKTILAQCSRRQHFENRLQKCVDVDDQTLESNTSEPNLKIFDSIQLPSCDRPGSFPVPGDCTLFYVCETNGHRMFANLFKCPLNMVYDADTEMCSVSSACKETTENSYMSHCASNIERLMNESKNKDDTEDTQSSTTETSSVSISPADIGSNYPESVTLIGDDASTISETRFTNNDVRDPTLKVNGYETTMDTTSVAYSTTSVDKVPLLEEIIVPTEVETTEPTLQTSTIDELKLNEQYSTIGPSNIDSTTSATFSTTSADEVPLLEEVTAFIEVRTEPALQTSTIDEFKLNEQYSTIGPSNIDSTTSDIYSTMSVDEGPLSEERSVYTEMETTEPTLQTSTIDEFKLNEQYNTMGPSNIDSTTSAIISTTSADEIPLLEEITAFIEVRTEPTLQTSTIDEFKLNEQYSTIGPSNIDSTTSPIYSTMSVDEVPLSEERSVYTEMETTEPTLQTSTIDEFKLNEQYTTIGSDNVDSTTSVTYSTTSANEVPLLEEISVPTEMETTEPTLQTSTMEEFKLNEQYSTIGPNNIDSTTSAIISTTGADEIPLLEEITAFIEVRTEPTLQTSTIDEFKLNEQYTTIGPSNIDFTTSTTYSTTSADEVPLLEELIVPTEMETTEPTLQTSTIDEFKLNEQYSTIGPSNIDSTTSTTYLTTSVDEVPLLEEITAFIEVKTEPTLQTSTIDEFKLNEQYSTIGPSNIDSTTSATYSTTSVDEVPFLEERSVYTEMETTVPTLQTSSIEEFKLNEQYSTIGPSNVDSTTSATYSTTSVDEVPLLEERSIPTEVGVTAPILEIELLPSSTDAANYVTTTSVTVITDDPGQFNKSLSEIDQVIQNFTKTLNNVASVESKLLVDNNENVNSNFSNPGVELRKCQTMLESLMADKQNISLIQIENIANGQHVIAPSLNDSRRTISSHIVLPLTSTVLNITDKFERKMRDIFDCTIC